MSTTYLANITTRRHGPLIVLAGARDGFPVLDLYSDDPLNEPVARLTIRVEGTDVLGNDEFYLDPDKSALQDDLIASGLFEPTGRLIHDAHSRCPVPVWRIRRN